MGFWGQHPVKMNPTPVDLAIKALCDHSTFLFQGRHTFPHEKVLGPPTQAMSCFIGLDPNLLEALNCFIGLDPHLLEACH